jgi:hypothetical protein
VASTVAAWFGNNDFAGTKFNLDDLHIIPEDFVVDPMTFHS